MGGFRKKLKESYIIFINAVGCRYDEHIKRLKIFTLSFINSINAPTSHFFSS